jgi:hypothetical protein
MQGKKPRNPEKIKHLWKEYGGWLESKCMRRSGGIRVERGGCAHHSEGDGCSGLFLAVSNDFVGTLVLCGLWHLDQLSHCVARGFGHGGPGYP